ncbi:MAG: VWA domain-containing protein [Rubricoccaceae bacterium]|nr:VWA domain-containing protein [Rubricoccaceae bacterium]
MDLTLAASPLLLLLALAAAGALTWWTYGRSTPRVTGVRRGLLVGLRFVALFVVVLLLFEPVFRNVERDEEPPVLAVLLDASESLTADPEGTSDEPPGAEAVRAALATLPSSDAVRLYRFAADLQPLAGDSLAFDGERTDIAGAIQAVESRLEGQNLRGIVLVSDGRYNTGRNPLYLAERARVPLYTAVVGDTTAQRDVQLSRVVTNEVAYLGSLLPVRVGVRARGFAGQPATVSLVEGGRTVASEAVTLPGDGLETTVELAVTPSQPGLRRYTVVVSRLPGEATFRNNSESVAVRVLDTRRRVLLVAGAPSPDLRALRTALEADPQVDLTVRTQRGPGAFYEGALPADLDRYDAAVLVGFPGPASGASAGPLAEAVAAGLPALFVLAAQTDLGALGRLFGDVLPASPAVVRPGTDEAGLVVTPAGSTHPVLQVPGVSSDRLDRLPPLSYSTSRWVPAPDARVLATVRLRGVPLDAPLLAVRASGGRRTAALLGAGSWRWAGLPADLDDLSAFYPGLMDNLLRWVTAREDRRPVRVRPSRALFGEREPVTFSGQVYDESLDPVADADLRVTITAPDGTQTPLTMRPLGNGRYALDAGVLPEGSYTYVAEAERTGQRLGEDRGAFAVGALALEFREPGADAALMRQLAQRSGGRVVPVDELADLPARLVEEGRLAARPIEQERETPLLHLPFLLGLVVVSLTAEWFVRKRSGMV